MKKILTLFGLLLFLKVFPQQEKITFGKISAQEIEMKAYEKDPKAKAVILYDIGRSLFFDTKKGYDIRFTKHKRIKVFDKTESSIAEVSIPFYVDENGKREIIKSIEAVTYNFKNGVAIKNKVNPSSIFEEKVSSRWLNKKFVFPDVQNGSILEYKYVLETPFHFNLPDWTFQDKIPTRYSEYEVRLIPFYEYVYRAQGVSKFDYQKSVVSKKNRVWGVLVKSYGANVGSGIEFQDYIHTYVLKDIPAFKDESYITSVNDYITKIDFQLAKFNSPNGTTRNIISTWKELNKNLLKNDQFGKYQKKCVRFAKIVLDQELNVSNLSPIKKSQEIINYVKDNFEWDGLSSKYAYQTAKEFFENKKGNSAEINLFLIALLNEAGIESHPIILSTRSNGKISTDYPFDNLTNYVIALVNLNFPFYSDGTEDFLPYNHIPLRCLNDIGLIVNKDDEAHWVKLTSTSLSFERNSLNLTIDPVSKEINTIISIRSNGYESLSKRNKFNSDSLKIIDYYTDKIGQISRHKSLIRKSATFSHIMFFESTFETEHINETIILKPFLNLTFWKNNLTQKKRRYPVDLIYASDKEFETILKVPLDYTVSNLPTPTKIENDIGAINLIYSIKKNTLIIKGNYKFNKAVYPADQFSDIKLFFDEIIKRFNEPIVLEKIKDVKNSG